VGGRPIRNNKVIRHSVDEALNTYYILPTMSPMFTFFSRTETAIKGHVTHSLTYSFLVMDDKFWVVRRKSYEICHYLRRQIRDWVELGNPAQQSHTAFSVVLFAYF